MDKSSRPEIQEQQHVRVEKHWYWLFRDIKYAIMMVVLGLGFVYIGIQQQYTGFYAIALLLMIIGVLFGMLELYQWNRSYFECTEADFIDHQQAALTFDDTTIHYPLIREVKVKQTPLGNLLGFSSIIIDSGGDDKVMLPFVKNHQEVKEYLMPRIGPPVKTTEPTLVTSEDGELRELAIPKSRQEPETPPEKKPEVQVKKKQAKRKTTKKKTVKKRKAPAKTTKKAEDEEYPTEWEVKIKH